MVLIDRSNTNMFKKISLGTQFFIFLKLWLIEKQYYEIVNKFWLVNYEIETAPTYEKSHSVPPPYYIWCKLSLIFWEILCLICNVKNALEDES